MGNANGCFGKIVVIIGSLIISLSSFFSGMNITDAPITEQEYPFVLSDDVVDYSFTETFNCQFEIGGAVEFLDGTSTDRENIVIKLHPLATYDDRPPAPAYIGSDNHYGLIIVGNYAYFVWVHDLASDTQLSEKVLVDNLNCADERIRATVNFSQIRDF